MAAIDELAGEAEGLENLAAVEEEAQALAATLKGLSAYAQSVNIEGVLADMNELTSILGEEGNNTSSLGRPPWSMSSKSLVQQRFSKMLNDTSGDWPPEMKEQVKTLREHVINRSAAELKYTLRLMKDEFTNLKFTTYEKELDGIEAARSGAINDEESDIQDLDMFLRGRGDSRTIGKVSDSREARFNMRDKACLVAGGLAYSRYLERGERASLQLLEAAAFVAGRRRRSPRKNTDASTLIRRDEDQYAALYGQCLDINGISRFSTDYKNWLLGRSLVKAVTSLGERALMSLGLKADQAAAADAINTLNPGDIPTNEFPDGPQERIGNLPNEAFDIPDVLPPQVDGFGENGGNAQTGLPDPDPQAAGVPTSPAFDQACRDLAAAARDSPEVTEEVQQSGQPIPSNDSPLVRFKRGLGEFVEGVKAKGRFFRRNFTTIVYMASTTLGVFLAFETFNQMAKEKSGCYVQNLKIDGSAESSVKLCHDATWPNTWSFSPNSKIKENCQDCYQVYQEQWKPNEVPQNLFDNGCTDVGDPDKRPCRATQSVEGFNYHWDATSVFDAMGQTIDEFTHDFGSCLDCATKLAAAALGGGLASIVAIIVILIILYAVYHIYKSFSSN